MMETIPCDVEVCPICGTVIDTETNDASCYICPVCGAHNCGE